MQTNRNQSLKATLEPHRTLLNDLARRYGNSPNSADADLAGIAARIMNCGIANDIVRLTAALGAENLKLVLESAHAGEFTDLAWRHWHSKLGVVPAPALPT